MQLADAISLIQAAETNKTGAVTWADLGCGTGIFTYALANLLQSKSKIYAVDKSAQRLKSTAAKDVDIIFQQADFTKEGLPFSPLDGILMANALHYVRNKEDIIERLKTYLAYDGMFIIIEYNTMRANSWVPYPVDEPHLQQLFSSAGFAGMKKLGERPSAYRNGNLVA